MIQKLEAFFVTKVLRRRRERPDDFDDWYVHCPKCGSVLVRRLGAEGPEWYCLCPAVGEGRRVVSSQ
jgi:hypothetical protein